MYKVVAAAALAAMITTTALAPAAPAPTIVVPVEPAPQRSSWGITLPILGVALLLAPAKHDKPGFLEPEGSNGSNGNGGAGRGGGGHSGGGGVHEAID